MPKLVGALRRRQTLPMGVSETRRRGLRIGRSNSSSSLSCGSCGRKSRSVVCRLSTLFLCLWILCRLCLRLCRLCRLCRLLTLCPCRGMRTLLALRTIRHVTPLLLRLLGLPRRLPVGCLRVPTRFMPLLCSRRPLPRLVQGVGNLYSRPTLFFV